MDLDRGVLARLDCRLLARTGRDVPDGAGASDGVQVVDVETVLRLGRRLDGACLRGVDRPGTVTIFGDHPDRHPAVFAERADEELAARQEQVARREEVVAAVEERLRAWNAHLRR